MKKLIIIFFIFTNPLFAQTIQPLTNYSFEDLVENENANHFVLEGCISLYSAITELTKKRYPEMANEFFEIAKKAKRESIDTDQYSQLSIPAYQ